MSILEKVAKVGSSVMGKFGDSWWSDHKNPSDADVSMAARLMEIPNLCDEFPYENFDPATNLFFQKRTKEGQNVGFVIEVNPFVGSNDLMQREITSLFTNILPEDSSLQVSLYADPDCETFFSDYLKVRQKGIYQTMAKNRIDYLRSLTINSELTVRNFRTFISFSQNFKNKVDVDEVISIKRQMLALLEGLNVSGKVWHADDLIKTITGIFSLPGLFNKKNPSTNKDPKWNRFDDLNRQVLPIGFGLDVDCDHLTIKSCGSSILAKTYGVKRYPQCWSLFAMHKLIGDFDRDQMQIPCPFIINYGVYIPKQNGLKTKLMGKTSYIEKQAYSPIGKFLPDIMEQATELAYVRSEMGRGEKIVKTNFSVTIFGDEQNIDGFGQRLKSLFISNDWDLEDQTFMHLPIFLSTFPLMWQNPFLSGLDYNGKLKTTLSTESSNLMPIQGEWKGTSTPSLLLTCRRGQVMKWSPFDTNAGNFNACVVGRSGSGKSVFMQELMQGTLSLGGRVFVMDVGRSFEKTCVLMSGQFIEFQSKSNLCLNPFSTIPTHDIEVTTDALAMLKSVFALMAAPSSNLDDMGMAILEKAVMEVWVKLKNKATISDVADYLLSLKDLKAKDMGTMLYPYTKKGAYGRFFNGVNNIDLSNNLIVVELEELKERKDLQAVIVQMMIITISNQMFLGDRLTPFNIVFDEAWDMLRHKQSGQFIETLARRLRKYNGSLIVGTQSINDFYENPGAKAAFDNSDWLCLLSQKSESVDQLKRDQRLNMTEFLEDQIKSLKTKKGKYAEIMIKGSEGFAIGRLMLDPFSNLLYSTQASDYQLIKNLKESGMTIKEAIEHVLKNNKR